MGNALKAILFSHLVCTFFSSFFFNLKSLPTLHSYFSKRSTMPSTPKKIMLSFEKKKIHPKKISGKIIRMGVLRDMVAPLRNSFDGIEDVCWYIKAGTSHKNTSGSLLSSTYTYPCRQTHIMELQDDLICFNCFLKPLNAHRVSAVLFLLKCITVLDFCL